MESTTSARRAFISGEQGFTISEVLIVTVLIGIVAVIASASWVGLIESRSVTSATNQLVADMRLSHTSASNQLSKWHLAYDVNGNSFSCGSEPNADYCLLKVSGSTVTKKIPRTLPDDTKIRGTNVDAVPPLDLLTYNRALQFNSNGSTDALGALGIPVTVTGGDPWLTVGLADDGDASPCHVVQVNRATSRVQIDPSGVNTATACAQ